MNTLETLSLAALILMIPFLADAGSGPVLDAQEQRIAMTLSQLKADDMIDPTNEVCNDPAAQAFGEALFFDNRLSANRDASCATCHQPHKGWAGGELPGKPAKRSTPSLWNVGSYRWYNWDGSADSLWAQSLGPIENPDEFATSRVTIVRRVMGEQDLRMQYQAVFGALPEVLTAAKLPASARPVTDNPGHSEHRAWTKLSAEVREAVDLVFANIGKAIAAFEGTLVSNNAPFDQFVAGLNDKDPVKLAAISDEAKQGFKLFVGKAQCVLCHSGPNFSDSEFHDVRVPSDNKQDLGRWSGINKVRASEFNAESGFNDAADGEVLHWVSYVVRSPETKGQFKTPTLRNLLSKGTYMHNGVFTSLDEVLDHYAELKSSISEDDHSEIVLKSLELADDEKDALKAFLASLRDESLLQKMKRLAVR